MQTSPGTLQSTTVEYLLDDKQDPIDVIADANGNVQQAMSFDACTGAHLARSKYGYVLNRAMTLGVYSCAKGVDGFLSSTRDFLSEAKQGLNTLSEKFSNWLRGGSETTAEKDQGPSVHYRDGIPVARGKLRDVVNCMPVADLQRKPDGADLRGQRGAVNRAGRAALRCCSAQSSQSCHPQKTRPTSV